MLLLFLRRYYYIRYGFGIWKEYQCKWISYLLLIQFVYLQCTWITLYTHSSYYIKRQISTIYKSLYMYTMRHFFLFYMVHNCIPAYIYIYTLRFKSCLQYRNKWSLVDLLSFTQMNMAKFLILFKSIKYGAIWADWTITRRCCFSKSRMTVCLSARYSYVIKVYELRWNVRIFNEDSWIYWDL